MRSEEFLFEGLEDAVIYRFRTADLQISRDWTTDSPPKSLLEKSWLRLTDNAMNDGQHINPRIVVRQGHPMLTNSLHKVPTEDLIKMPFKHLLESRVIQCKYKNIYPFDKLLFKRKTKILTIL